MTPIIEKESADEAEHPHVDVPTKKRFLWGMGGFADILVIQGVGASVSTIYTNALGINAALVGLACAIPRFLDFVTDPLIGHLSDNTRSRWGRRRPWMLLGLIVSAVLGVLLWHPPASTSAPAPEGFLPLVGYCLQNPVFWYLSVMMTLLYSVGYASFSITHAAMGYEMSTDYNERTHLFKWRLSACALAGFVTPWVLPLAVQLEGDASQQLRGSQGILTVSYVIGALILLVGLPSVLFCREKVFEHKYEEKVSFLSAVRLTLGNRPFWLLVASNFISKFLMCLTGIFFYYIFVYHIAAGDQKAGPLYQAVFFLSINVANLLAMAPVAALTERVGKKPSLLIMLMMSAVAYATCWFTLSNAPGAFLNLPLPWGAPGNALALQWPCLLTGLLIGIFTNTMPMIQNSMIADVCDLDELTSGHRREAFYGAVFVTTDKIAIAVSLAFQGFMLVYSGFNSKLEMQTAATIQFWLLALIVTQPIGCLIGLFSIFLYPLTRERCHAIRAELSARKEARA
ncbi:MAG: MFS transporter [bacterium]